MFQQSIFFLRLGPSAKKIYAFFIVLLQLVGNIAVSAYAITAKMNIIAITIFTGIGQGIQPPSLLLSPISLYIFMRIL